MHVANFSWKVTLGMEQTKTHDIRPSKKIDKRDAYLDTQEGVWVKFMACCKPKYLVVVFLVWLKIFAQRIRKLLTPAIAIRIFRELCAQWMYLERLSYSNWGRLLECEIPGPCSQEHFVCWLQLHRSLEETFLLVAFGDGDKTCVQIYHRNWNEPSNLFLQQKSFCVDEMRATFSERVDNSRGSKFQISLCAKKVSYWQSGKDPFQTGSRITCPEWSSPNYHRFLSTALTFCVRGNSCTFEGRDQKKTFFGPKAKALRCWNTMQCTTQGGGWHVQWGGGMSVGGMACSVGVAHFMGRWWHIPAGVWLWSLLG